MTGLEYQNTVCPTTASGKDPNREDVADAFEDGIAEGYRRVKKEAMNYIDLLQWFVVSVDSSEPIWTDAHIEELCKDFIIIRKEMI